MVIELVGDETFDMLATDVGRDRGHAHAPQVVAEGADRFAVAVDRPRRAVARARRAAEGCGEGVQVGEGAEIGWWSDDTSVE